MSAAMNEAVVEEATLDILSELGWGTLYGPDLAPGGRTAERTSYGDPMLQERLRVSLERLNPDKSPAAIDDAMRILNQTSGPTLLHANRELHKLITNGVAVELMEQGRPRGHLVKVVDFDNPDLNTFLAVNQFTVTEGNLERRPDVVLFVNGLPLAVIELKNAASEQTDVWEAWRKLQNYQKQIPRMFRSNVALVASDGIDARMGALGTPQERFVAWKTIDGEDLAPAGQGQLEVLLKGVFEPRRFLDYARSFVVFEQEPEREEIAKKIAAYHQFHAVRKALACTVEASGVDGDRRGGVIWHTQGSGKSLTMLFFAGKLILSPAMANPTIVMLTDRNDLDDQLFGQFARGHDVLRQAPEQAESRAELRALLRRAGWCFRRCRNSRRTNGGTATRCCRSGGTSW